ncbi:MAG: nucleotidyltransferase family protein [Chloroflexota bacterium]
MAILDTIDPEQLATFCRHHHIRRLSLFGSALRPDFGPESDIDLLVEFEPEHFPELFGLAGTETELTWAPGRKVDLRTKEDLSRYFRQQVIDSAEVLYVP